MTMQVVRLKPARPGLVVRGPDGVRLPAAGLTVPLTTFWARRLRDGDVVAAGAAAAGPAEAGVPAAGPADADGPKRATKGG